MVDQNRIVQDSDSIAEVWCKTRFCLALLNVSDADALAIAEQRLAQFQGTTPRIRGFDCQSFV